MPLRKGTAQTNKTWLLLHQQTAVIRQNHYEDQSRWAPCLELMLQGWNTRCAAYLGWHSLQRHRACAFIWLSQHRKGGICAFVPGLCAWEYPVLLQNQLWIKPLVSGFFKFPISSPSLKVKKNLPIIPPFPTCFPFIIWFNIAGYDCNEMQPTMHLLTVSGIYRTCRSKVNRNLSWSTGI